MSMKKKTASEKKKSHDIRVARAGQEMIARMNKDGKFVPPSLSRKYTRGAFGNQNG